MAYVHNGTEAREGERNQGARGARLNQSNKRRTLKFFWKKNAK